MPPVSLCPQYVLVSLHCLPLALFPPSRSSGAPLCEVDLNFQAPLLCMLRLSLFRNGAFHCSADGSVSCTPFLCHSLFPGGARYFSALTHPRQFRPTSPVCQLSEQQFYSRVREKKKKKKAKTQEPRGTLKCNQMHISLAAVPLLPGTAQSLEGTGIFHGGVKNRACSGSTNSVRK